FSVSNFGTGDWIGAISLDPSGRILAVGASGSNGQDSLVVARYTAAGVLDATFGTGGSGRTVTAAGRVNGAHGLVTLADGSMMIVYTNPPDDFSSSVAR